MKGIVTLVVILALATQALGCGVCGCGPGGYFIGISPLYQKNFAGLRLRTAAFESGLGTGEYGRLFSARQQITTLEAWGRYYVAPAFQLQATIPYQRATHRPRSGSTDTYKGLGDASVIGLYRLLNHRSAPDSTRPVTLQELWLGGGVKTATGRYVPEVTTRALGGLSTGSGSWDPLLNARYQLRRGRHGLVAEVFGRLPMRNAQGFTFGPRGTAQVMAFTVRQWGQWGLVPNAGVLLEAARRDQILGIELYETGGRLTMATLGADVFVRGWNLSLSASAPLAQHLAQGTQKAGFRSSVTLSRQL